MPAAAHAEGDAVSAEYVPRLRRNDMRRRTGELRTTTVELPRALMDRARTLAREKKVPLRSLFERAILEHLGDLNPPAWARIELPRELRKLRDQAEIEVAGLDPMRNLMARFVLRRCIDLLDALIRGGAA